MANTQKNFLIDILNIKNVKNVPDGIINSYEINPKFESVGNASSIIISHSV